MKKISKLFITAGLLTSLMAASACNTAQANQSAQTSGDTPSSNAAAPAAPVAPVASAAPAESAQAAKPEAESNFKYDSSIYVVSREDGSGTRGAFVELFGVEVKDDSGNKKDMTTKEADIVNKTDVMLTSIEGSTYAIGYVSMGSLNNSIKALKVDGAEATPANIKSGEYKISRPFIIATAPGISDTASDFISFILSKDGQNIVSNGYIAVDEAAADYTAAGASGKIVVAGSSSVTPIMEKLAEAYMEINQGVSIEIQMTDSSAGLSAATEGTCDIGMASRNLKDSEKEKLEDIVIALDGIAVIVNNDNPIDDIASDDVRTIFIGETLTWDELK